MDWQPGQPLRTETKRFIIRSLTPADVTETYVRWWNDPEIQDGLNFPARGWNWQRAVQHVSGFDNEQTFHLGIFCKDTRRLIGFFAVFLNPHTKVAKTNIVIGEKDYWGKQVVQEVRGHMLSIIFEIMGMEKVKGEVHGNNYASIFNCKSMGFTCEGILRSEEPHFSGKKRIDMYIFGLLREEWLEQKKRKNNE